MGKGSSGKARRGGAGIPSTPGISENERAAAGMERIRKERYNYAKKLFEDELGFKDASAIANLAREGGGMALLGAQARKLKQLEDRYGAIHQSDTGMFGDMKSLTLGASGNAIAWVAHRKGSERAQRLELNSEYYGNSRKLFGAQRDGESSSWNAKTDGKVTSRATYSITHEYGHMLANVMTAKSNDRARANFERPKTSAQFTASAKRTIVSTAVKKYGAKKGDVVSRYGSSSSAEFFAEAFASAHSGSPNAFGKAMQDWLKKQGF